MNMAKSALEFFAPAAQGTDIADRLILNAAGFDSLLINSTASLSSECHYQGDEGPALSLEIAEIEALRGKVETRLLTARRQELNLAL
jgi:hypothetical protein